MIPQIFTIALAILLLLEANRFDAFLERKFQINTLPHFGPSLVIMIIIIVRYGLTSFSSGSGTPSLGIHSQHIQLAKEAQQNSAPASIISPALAGDKSKRFTVSFLHPDLVEANKDAELKFLVNDASSGNPVNFFNKVYEKPMHLIIVDSSLNYFSHIHPEQVLDGFEISTQFPRDGVYHLYQDFQPSGAIEQQFAFTLPVGASPSAELSKLEPDTNLTKKFGDYDVSLSFSSPLKASQMSIGSQKLTFTIMGLNGQPVTNLKPYLAAFGHLVMINQETFDYLHVHPYIIKPPLPEESSGPQVEFLPLGLYGPIKPGIYRIFAQFNPDGKLFTADFTVEVMP